MDLVLSPLLNHFVAGGRLALLFDYDGTLTELADHPSQAVLPAARRELLQRLAGLPRVTVGVLSGRGIDDVRGMVGLPGLYYVGTAGLELEFPDGRFEHPRASEARRSVAALADALEPAAAACPGAWIERKPLGLTVHYRASPPAAADAMRRRVAETLGPMADQLRVLYGPMALEVTPALGWTKATALDRILRSAGAGVLPLYAGDSENDADALDAADRLGGVALGIGPQAPAAARYRLADPGELFGLLTDLAAALERTPGR